MAHCKVWLDNYHTGQYYPGSQIQGKVVLNFNSQTEFRKIAVRMFGHEHTEWTGTEEYTENNERKTRDVQLYADNDVFSTELILQGGNTGTGGLPVGQHIYPFSFTLPTDIPSTYSCEYGSITYKVVATVDRPMAFDYEDQIIFVVVSLVDLNFLRNPALLQSTSYSDDKTVCCWCCAQGPITMDITLPKRTLVPGETVDVPVRLTNMSNTNIERTEFKLIQKITCKLSSSVETKVITNNIFDLNEVGVGAHGEHTFTFPIQLPANCIIPNVTKCKFIKVQYIYEVTAVLPGVHSNLSIQMFPEIGNIDIGQQAPVGGFGNQNNTPYPVGPPFPGPQPSSQYPLPGQYPPPAQYPPGAFPPSGNQQYPPPPGAYPPQSYPSGAYGAPSATAPGYPGGKAQEAAGGYPSAPAPPHGDQFPPSYDSINPPKQ